jgi:hypothetical protein
LAASLEVYFVRNSSLYYRQDAECHNKKRMARMTHGIWRALSATGVTFALAVSPAVAKPGSDLSFLVGVEDAEDLLLIPGTDWIVASGMGRDKPHGALHLINARTKAWSRWFPDQPLRVRLDAGAYPDCVAPPDPARFWSQGLSLRPTGPLTSTLYVAGHGEREAIEVFDVDARGATPLFTWKGCARMPEGLAANSVTSTPSGVLLASVLFHPGRTMADSVEGRATGGVYRRGPAATAFQLIPGTELPGDNGVESAPDGSAFYIVAWGLKAVLRFSLTHPDQAPTTITLPFHPDNVHWGADGRLIAAGMTASEPACGGPFRVIAGKVDLSCHRGYEIAAIDPASLKVTPLVSGPPHPDFANVSTALFVGDEVWLGSFRADRLAHRKFIVGDRP